MRNPSAYCAALLLIAAAPAPAQDGATTAAASAPPPITFTRAELAGMSSEQLAARALAAIAASARSVSGGPAWSFFNPHPSPWVARIDVELPLRNESGLCRHQILHLELQPVHYEPARMTDPAYDPPAAIRGVELQTFYADPGPGAPNCPDPHGLAYFPAPDAEAAVAAIRAFRLFREAVRTGALPAFSCRSADSQRSCRGARADLAGIARFDEVRWLEDGMVALAIGQTMQLRLAIEYRGSDSTWRLTRTELVLRVPPPPV